MFIDRNQAGQIVGAYYRKQYQDQEEVANDDSALVAFLSPPANALQQLEDLISQGQIAMAEAPLPADLQKKIFDLEVFVQNYYKRGAIPLIVDSINEFTIPPERTDVTSGQREQVEALKTQMLAAFQ